MRKVRKFGTALALATFVATGMMASSASLYAAGPGGGHSQTVLCGLLQRAINSATELGATDLAAFLQGKYDANCTAS